MTGLDYNYARHYDSRTGRYLTKDPLGYEAGTNAYSYVGDPLTGIDPFGLFSIDLKTDQWCNWRQSQRRAFQKKVDRYNDYIKDNESSKGQGIKVSKCARNGKQASKLWAQKNCCNRKPPKQKKPKGGVGNADDCTKDIDHIIDCQLGGPQDCKAVCDNLVPVNSSVNSSFGPSIDSALKKELAGKAFAFLTEITFKPPRCKQHNVRTPTCV